MNKNFYFLLSVIVLIVITVVLIFYPSEPEIYNTSGNITFKDTKLSNSGPLVFEDMKATIDMDNHRRLKVAKYRDNAKLKTLGQTNVNYVNSELTLASGSNLPRTTLAANTPQGFRRYISDNSSAQSVVNIAGFQQLNVANAGVLNQVGGVVQIGNIAAVAFDDCSHENIEWSDDGPWGHCTDCGGNGTITGDINSDGTIDIDDMEWVPIGDIVVPMMLFGFIYLLLCFLRRNSFMQLYFYVKEAESKMFQIQPLLLCSNLQFIQKGRSSPGSLGRALSNGDA